MAAAAGQRRWTPWAILAHDVALAALVMWATLVVRYHFEGKPLPLDMAVKATLAFAAISAGVFLLSRQHLGLWRFTALNDLARIFRAVVVSILLLLPVLFVINRAEDFPRSAPFVVIVLATLVLSLGRGIARWAGSRDPGALFRFEDRGAPAAVVVGTTDQADRFLKAYRARRDAPARVAGVVAVGSAPVGRLIRGAEVLGELPRLPHVLRALTARDDEAPRVILADPRPGRALLEQVTAAASETGCQIMRARREGDGAALAPLGAVDLLRRPPKRLDEARARSLIQGRRVLVTGAGGTIGSELTRQVAGLNPARLILLDNSEYALYAVDMALRERGGDLDWTAELGDVRDRERLAALFERERPDVVLHAAALKHVPLMQTHPAEAVLTNLTGAIHVAELACARCEALVFVSTDKAVNPSNVMGATKRLAERAVLSLSAGASVKASVVRFGNVLGSSGSVAPLFERQILEGGPVTVTHPDMTRWFMTVQEAASLVLQAGALPAPGAADGLFVLDMGDPVRIDDLARQMIALHGLRPDQDVAIVYTGLRPGEKLEEELFYPAEDVAQTEAEGVLCARTAAETWADLGPRLAELTDAARARDDARVLALLHALEPAFRG